MNRWLVAVLTAVVLVGCGEKGSDQSFNDNTMTPPSPYVEQLQLISAVQLADKRWEYHLALSLESVKGDKSTPFFQSNSFDWAVLAGTVVNGWIEFKIKTYDRLCSVIYGGNFSLQSWADLHSSGYYVTTQDALGFGLQNGALVKWNDFVATQYGGTATDPAGVVGFTLTGDQLDIYFNLSHIAGSLANPFWFGDQTGYTKQPIEILDSHGWALKTVTIADGQVIKFTYGGDGSDGATWAYIIDSKFYNPTADFIVVGRLGNTIVAR